jgi:methenyltetrahydromethanopterin cyclohydrolase
MNLELNDRAIQLLEDVLESVDDFRIIHHDDPDTGVLVDFGIDAEGGLDAGQVLAAICMAGMAEVAIVPGQVDGMSWPHVSVCTDFPVASCLFSQYAGWQLSVGKYFAMGSGPMRAAAGTEGLFDKLWYREQAEQVLGVLETSKLPSPDVFEHIATATGVAATDVVLLVAPTSSMAGNLQVVARSVETAMHKLYELGFDVQRVRSGFGTAPLAPVAANDLQGIGRTNDAILYGAQVTLCVNGDDDTLSDVIKKLPACTSDAYGQPFLEVFEAAARDFYKIDKMLFSPAEIILHNVDTGRVHHAGKLAPEILRRSFLG